jgi:hypothetical protein
MVSVVGLGGSEQRTEDAPSDELSGQLFEKARVAFDG